MPKYRVYAVFSAPSKCLGVFEGTKEEIEQKIYDEKGDDLYVNICYACSRELGGGDVDFIKLDFEEEKDGD